MPLLFITSTNFPWKIGWPTPPPSLSNSRILSSLLCKLHKNENWPTMGIISLSLVLHSPLVSPCHFQTRPIPRLGLSNWFQAPTTARTKHTSVSVIRAQSGARKEDIVIVGAGIAGLATALSLHRYLNICGPQVILLWDTTYVVRLSILIANLAKVSHFQMTLDS